MDKIKEVMGLVLRYGNLQYSQCDAEYRDHFTRSEQYEIDQRETYARIESKLRELLEREPLKRSEHKDALLMNSAYCYNDDAYFWAGVRYAERTHVIGICKESKEM